MSTTHWIAIAPLHNFFVPDTLMSDAIRSGTEPLIRFHDTAAIYYLNEEAEKQMMSWQIMRTILRMRSQDHEFAICVRYEVDNSVADYHPIQATVTERVEKILESMRVFQSGLIYLGGIAQNPLPATGVTDLVHKSWPLSSFPWAIEDANFITALVDFHKRRTDRANARFNMAIHWFSRAVEETRIDDKLLSLMTAAEVIVRPTRRENKRDQIASHISAASPVDEQRISNLLKDAYRLRNDYVHDGVAGLEWNEDLVDPNVSEHFVTMEVQEVLRKHLKRTIESL